jgi:hypothetical protein
MPRLRSEPLKKDPGLQGRNLRKRAEQMRNIAELMTTESVRLGLYKKVDLLLKDADLADRNMEGRQPST